VLLLAVTTALGQTYVTDDITASETWTTTGSPYIINHDIYVLAPSTLTIEPGVTVKLDSLAKLRTEMNSSIVAVGIESDEILFTSGSDTPEPNDWYAVDVSNSPTSVFTYCTFEYGRYNLYANGGSHMSVSHCTSRYANTAAFMCEDSSPTLTDCQATNSGQGIRLSGDALPNVTSCTLINNQTGIYINGPDANPVIHGCNIHDNGENVYARAYSELPQVIIDAENNWWGVDSYLEIGETINIGPPYAPYVAVDYDPWLPEAPVEELSWARVKALFRND
jgi:parallel beta-helix repeat protein